LWEQAFFDFQLSDTRQVALRMAIVLGKDGGVMQPLKRLVKFRLGGKQGNGKQMFSWIHIEDIFRIILFLIGLKELDGVVNCSSPNPVTNEVLLKSLRKASGMNIGLPSPEWLLKIEAVLIRTETELILKSSGSCPSDFFNVVTPSPIQYLSQRLKKF
jgi:NAD dependent epimerase/dehydratase family enzyme